MSKIKIKYSIKGEDVNNMIALPNSSTFKNLLNLVNKRKNKSCNKVFLNGSLIDNEEKIVDYIEDDSIFILEKTEKIISPTQPSEPGKFRFFATCNEKILLSGIDVDLKMSDKPSECCDSLLAQLESNGVDVKNKKLLVYLAGGIPFNSGTIGDLYSNNEITDINNSLYGVLINRISHNILEKTYDELCNISSKEIISLFSPICESSKKGLCDMACLLGYLNRNGPQSELFLKASTAIIRFPPLITSLKHLIDKKPLTGNEIVTITSSLFIFFRYLIPVTINDNKVFEYSLHCCNFICNIKKIPEDLPILEIDPNDSVSSSNEELEKLKSAIKQIVQPSRNTIYFWKIDAGEIFHYFEIDKPDPKEIEDALETYKTFTPVAPLTLNSANDLHIIKGKFHSFLYMRECDGYYTILDPTKGQTQQVNLETFAAEQKKNYNDVSNLIDPDQVKQIIFVCFDTSNSMNCDVRNDTIICLDDIISYPKLSEISTRMTVSTQYLTTFANMAYGFRIPCIQGLISFDTRCKVRCPLSPLVPDFENKGLKDIKADGYTHLWDAISLACDGINSFSVNKRGENIYKNASKRILVISDGEDYVSKVKVEEVAKKLIQSNIIVDCVIVTQDDSCKMLAVLCHLTGGIAYRPNTIKEGLSLFEKRAFLNLEDRIIDDIPLISNDSNTKPSCLKSKPEKITKEFMENAINFVNYDQYPKYKYENISIKSLSTPLHFCFVNRDKQMKSLRDRRIMKELRSAAKVMDIHSDNFDEDLKIYPFESKIDRWLVLIKAPITTLYENKWFSMLVEFPDSYPYIAPIFQFITIPYHLNISSEGRICLDSVEKGYLQTSSVIDIIQNEIKAMFIEPKENSAIQLDVLNCYKYEREKYIGLAKQSAAQFGKNNFTDFLNSVSINDKVDSDFKILSENDIPIYFKSPISGKPLNKDNTILASSGIWYDRDELRQLVVSSEHPRCVVTGKLLTETPNDFQPR